MINALPVLDRNSSTFRDDSDLYFDTDLPVFSTEFNTGWTEMNASTILAQQAGQQAVNAVTSCTTEVQLATQQAQAAALSALSVGAILWVSGTTYTVGVSRYSPLNSQVYRRLIAGAGTTDPSLDTVNWKVVNSLPNENIVIPVNNLPLVRPSLLLDFANSQVLDSRITFSRASTATRTNAKGLIEVVPANTPRIDFDAVSGACKGLLIEEARTNLLTYSQDFYNNIWIRGNSIVTSDVLTAPDGTFTADKFIETTATSAYHYINQAVIKPALSLQYTGTVYIKDAGRQVDVLLLENASSSGASVRVNPATGTITAGVSTFGTMTAPFASVTSVGNGWYRVAITATTSSFTDLNIQVTSFNGTSAVYTGDGTSGIFIWGAQLEAGAFPTSYQPSIETFTGRTSIGTYYGSNGLLQTALSGVARLNYNPMDLSVQPKLLLEGAATNLLTYSTDIAGTSWFNVTSVYTVAASDVVDPTGALTAKKFTKTAVGDSVFARQSVAFTLGVTYTVSVWVYVPVQAGVSNFSFNFDLNDVESSSLITSTLFNQWVRLSVSKTAAANRTAIDLDISVNGIDPVAGFIFHAFGAQVEVGAFPTSYIPTVASTVTRSADTSTSAVGIRQADVASMTGVNFSSWYRQEEGSFVITSIVPYTIPAGVFPASAAFTDGTVNNCILNGYLNSTNSSLEISTVSISQVALYPTVTAQKRCTAGVYRLNDFAVTTNGGAVATDTIGTVPNVNQLRLGDRTGGNPLNGCIQSLIYYPERLSNATLQALSTQ